MTTNTTNTVEIQAFIASMNPEAKAALAAALAPPTTSWVPELPALPEWMTRGYTKSEGRQAIGAAGTAASIAMTGDPMLGAAFALTGALLSADARTPEALLGAAAATAASYAFGPLAGAAVTLGSLLANRAIVAITTPTMEPSDVVV